MSQAESRVNQVGKLGFNQNSSGQVQLQPVFDHFELKQYGF